MNQDTAMGMVGALLLTAAMAGVFFYERGQFDTYEVSWSSDEVNVPADGSLQAGETNTSTFQLDVDRLSAVHVSLEWSDDIGQADTFELSVQGPNGSYTANPSDDSSPLEADFAIHDQPTTSTVTARSIDDAREQVNTTESWPNGTGEWTVTVELVSAPGDQSTVPGQGTDDGSEDYELTFAYERWMPSLARN